MSFSRKRILTGALLLLLAASRTPALTVDTRFEGGSAVVTRLDESSRTIEFHPAGDPFRGWPSWWYLRIDGCTPGEQLTLKLRGSPKPMPQPGPGRGRPLPPAWSQVTRPAVSFDGVTWTQGEPGTPEDDSIVYRITATQSSVWVAWGPPFTPKDAIALVKRLAAAPGAEALELARTREGRAVPMLRVATGALPPKERFGVWIQARQHAWEAGSSWVARGFGEWLLGNDPDAAWLREHAEIFLVPIMDIDNVATGNGGKDALPHDHNRDWSEEPHWPEVRAVQDHVRALVSQGRMDVFLDLHNPGPTDKTFFYALSSGLLSESGWALTQQFMAIAQRRIGAVRPMQENARESGPGYHPLWTAIGSNWVAINGNPQTVSLCLETAWNTAQSTPADYEAVGAALGRTLQEYLAGRSAPGR